MGNYFQDFLKFLRDNGFDPIDKIIADDSPRRLKQRGDKGGKTTAMYVLKIDERGAVGRVTDFKRNGQVFVYKSGGKKKIPKEESEKYRKQQLHDRLIKAQELFKQRKIVADRARGMWESGLRKGKHPYLTKKKIPLIGARIKNGLIIVPVYDENNRIVNLQKIFRRDSAKRFLTCGQIKGAFCPILTKNRDTIYICEGWATGVSIHLSLNATVICALASFNLDLVGQIVRKKYPASKIIFCADNDSGNEENTGVNAGKHAATSVNGYCIWPEEPGDWNDYYIKHGAIAVKNAIMAELPESKIA